MTDLAQDLCKRLSTLETNRSTWDAKWQQIAERILPQHAIFQFNHSTLPPERRVDQIVDATAAHAVTRFAAILESILTPKQAKWHSLQPSEPALRRSYRVQRYLEDVRDLLFRKRYASTSGFASQISEVYLFLGAFGTAPFLIEDDVGRGIRYRRIHLAETYLTTDYTDRVDGVWRKYRLTARQARQARQLFPNLPERIGREVTRALEKEPDKEFWFCHAVMPANDYVPGVEGPAGFPIRSYYLAVDTKELCGTGGYRSMPYAVPRYMSTGTPYGWSPGMLILPEIKTANEMRKTLLRQGQIATDPPNLLYGSADGVMDPFNVKPGYNNYGYVSQDGKPLAVPYVSGANLAEGREELAGARQSIQAAFLIDLIQILIQKPNMTATEVLEWSQEKGDLLAPTMGKQQEELLGRIIERELTIEAEAGELPPMPPELQEAGGAITVQYEGPLSRFQRAGEAAGFARTIETTAAMIQLKPEVLDNFDEDAVLRNTAEINGVPASWLKDPDIVAQARAQRQAQQQEILAEQNIPGRAAAAKSLAQAEQIGAKAA